MLHSTTCAYAHHDSSSQRAEQRCWHKKTLYKERRIGRRTGTEGSILGSHRDDSARDRPQRAAGQTAHHAAPRIAHAALRSTPQVRESDNVDGISTDDRRPEPGHHYAFVEATYCATERKDSLAATSFSTQPTAAAKAPAPSADMEVTGRYDRENAIRREGTASSSPS